MIDFFFDQGSDRNKISIMILIEKKIDRGAVGQVGNIVGYMEQIQ